MNPTRRPQSHRPRTRKQDGQVDLEGLFREHGFADFRWIDPKDIILGEWVRMKCLYGCVEYGRTATCPPNAPAVEACERFFREYDRAVVFHFEKKVDRPEDRHAWSRKINIDLLKLEREVFMAGFFKAFLLYMDSCNICLECSGNRAGCKDPKQARPTPDALGVDVYTTVRKLGYPIEVLSDYKQTMNRYAFLLIE
jgi:predicted metal-binding protein